MDYFPLFLDLRDQSVLVVGGGDIALRKTDLLLRAGARISVVAPTLHPQLADYAASRRLTWFAGAFDPSLVAGTRLVVAATDDDHINAQVSLAATAANVLVNVVDDREKSNAIFPAIVDRSPVVVAISSGGASPVLTRLIREKLETVLSPALGSLAQLLKKTRHELVSKLQRISTRRRVVDRILTERVLPKLEANLPSEAAAELADALALCEAREGDHKGRVMLVGAGPGDAGLLTIKGLRALQQADVIVHDRLVSHDVLDLARRDAEKILVGKEGGGPSTAQDDINQLLVTKAQQGLLVVRLKGGDPFIFGRGGEELQVLRAHNIPYEVVPGITAALGCAAYAGIPLTHRDHAQAVTFTTAHYQQGAANSWARFADKNHTLAIYMGVKQAVDVQHGLIAAGRHGSTPVAIIENGSHQQQRVVRGRLDQLSVLVNTFAVSSPALLVVGEVTALAEQLHWFGQAPESLLHDVVAAVA